MDNLLAARYQMSVSFIFHIVFACIGMAMPWLMFVAEYKWIRTGKAYYLDLAKAWSRGVAIFFAVGAVSGTVLSFELGLLWPKFMEHAGIHYRYAFFLGRDCIFPGGYCPGCLPVWLEPG